MAILIVEDEKKLVDILRIALKGERYSVEVAYDGEEGLAKAMKNDYSLILLDIMLPKKDGLAICRELRAREIHTPIIILTARGSEEDRVAGLNAGADDYLIKPFGLNELFARIRAVLRRRKTSNPIPKTAIDAGSGTTSARPTLELPSQFWLSFQAPGGTPTPIFQELLNSA